MTVSLKFQPSSFKNPDLLTPQRDASSPSLSQKNLERCRKLIKDAGAPRNPASPNKNDIDYIARTVMRHPNEETRDALYLLHEAIKTKLSFQSDEGLNWLLGGCSRTARGGFKDVSSLKKFLEANPRLISSSRLITGLETLVTAIAYRLSKDPQGVIPHIPETREQQLIYNLFATVLDHWVPDHSISYPDSRSSLVAYTGEDFPMHDIKNHFISPCRQEISDGSDMEEEEFSSRKRRGGIFIKKIGPNKTWVGAANEGNIPIRLGISATTLGSLSVIEWLFTEFPGTLDKKEIELFTAILILPTYIRGDYHSIAEITAALQHFLAHRNGGDPSTGFLTPQAALKKGLDLLCAVTDLEYQYAITQVSTDILKMTINTMRKK